MECSLLLISVIEVNLTGGGLANNDITICMSIQ